MDKIFLFMSSPGLCTNMTKEIKIPSLGFFFCFSHFTIKFIPDVSVSEWSGLTFEPLVGRADHGIALFPVKLYHSAKSRRSISEKCINYRNHTSESPILSPTGQTSCAGGIAPVYVLEETLLSPTVQQLRHHELRRNNSQLLHLELLHSFYMLA